VKAYYTTSWNWRANGKPFMGWVRSDVGLALYFFHWAVLFYKD